MSEILEDKYGIWKIAENGIEWILVKPSDEYLEEKNKHPIENTSEPTQEERIAALEQALLDLLG